MGSQSPATARAVFNQSLSTIQSHFGRYHTRLTTVDDGKTTKRIYTFNTSGLRKAIPGLPQGTKFAIEFVNDRAQNVFIDLPGIGATSARHATSSFDYNQGVAQKFFRYVLGWNSNEWSELNYSLYGKVNIHGHPIEETFEYCLGSGVATAWELQQGGLATDPKIYYHTKCE